MPPTLRLTLLALSSALTLAACASCPFEQRCQGNQLETCWLGVDQMFGDPEYFTELCDDPNPVCVETSARTAQCAMAADATCSVREPDRCGVGALAVRCERGYEVGEDCFRDGNDCLLLDGHAQCAIAPGTPCDHDTYRNSCEDDAHLLYCGGGLVTRMDCAEDGKSACVPNVPKDQYEQSAHCRAPVTDMSDAGVDGS